eukprot:NODE_4935_length_720_cov_530.807757_g4772_i0.p1 GENE.NODE_4935_length_720_cov_530.807757_g4772_i0~~NODE_4935_length_720_cov_530.807757_g4772_i0.p1  ORF type:complete len:177 (+),score=20.21 NODE_4935_length_720_cov_530.807757_g4772_i0:75-605(+)
MSTPTNSAVRDTTLEELADRIASVEQQILIVGDLLDKADPEQAGRIQFLRTEKEQLRTKEQQLRTEKEQLRTEKEQLRKKEEQLREEKLILLRKEDKPTPQRGLFRWVILFFVSVLNTFLLTFPAYFYLEDEPFGKALLGVAIYSIYGHAERLQTTAFLWLLGNQTPILRWISGRR